MVDVAELEQRIRDHRWYHTLELAPGVQTPGWFDTRRALDLVPIPRDLRGMRCLDVGTFDGFWAFAMEQRGADEVVAIDVLDPRGWDWPVGADESVIAEMATMKAGGAGFDLAAEALQSMVKRQALSVYDLDPAQIGTFDFVYVGSLLLHLRDPVRAIERVASVAHGDVVLVDAIDLELTLLHPRRAVAGFDGIGRPWWWKPNVAAFARLVESGGLEVVDGPQRFYMPPGEGQPLPKPSLGMLRRRSGRETFVTARRGDPHAALRARRRSP